MQFQVRDLMINVLPDEANIAAIGPCGGITRLCPAFTGIPTGCSACTLLISDICGICTVQPTIRTLITTTGCGVNFSTCPAGSVTFETIRTVRTGTLINPAVPGGDRLTAPQNLAALKAELQQAIAQVEAQEKALADSLQPQSLEDLDLLEQKLTEALEDVRNQKGQAQS